MDETRVVTVRQNRRVLIHGGNKFIKDCSTQVSNYFHCARDNCRSRVITDFFRLPTWIPGTGESKICLLISFKTILLLIWLLLVGIFGTKVGLEVLNL